MIVEVTSPPKIEPVTVPEARRQLRIEFTDEDDLLAFYIKTATAQAETIAQRSLITQTRRLTMDSFPGAIRVPYGPVQSVDSISYIDTAGVQQTHDPADRQEDLRSAPPVIVPAYHKTWPATRDQLNAVELIYVAGYGDEGDAVPVEIRHAILLMAGHWFENREATTPAAAQVKALPETLGHRELLLQYRVWSS